MKKNRERKRRRWVLLREFHLNEKEREEYQKEMRRIENERKKLVEKLKKHYLNEKEEKGNVVRNLDSK